MKNVTIRELHSNGKSWTTTHRTDSDSEAINRAVQKNFGRSAFFFADSGLSGMSKKYGQIFQPCGFGQSTSLTGRISIEIN